MLINNVIDILFTVSYSQLYNNFLLNMSDFSFIQPGKSSSHMLSKPFFTVVWHCFYDAWVHQGHGIGELNSGIESGDIPVSNKVTGLPVISRSIRKNVHRIRLSNFGSRARIEQHSPKKTVLQGTATPAGFFNYCYTIVIKVSGPFVFNLLY